MDTAQPRMIQIFDHAPSRFRRLWALLSLVLALTAFGCGGGSSNQQSSPPPATSDFSLAANPTTVTVFPNNGVPVSISATAINGFTSQISVQVTGLPAGVSATPATFTLSPGTSQNVILSATASASIATTATTFTGTSGSLSHTANVNVSVSQETPEILPTRTQYVRSDAVTEYGYSLNTHWEVFHNATSRFFVTDPYSNRVFVFDSTTEAEVGSIVVPGAYGIDQTPDGSTLYVGTLIGDVYTIDPVSMTVTQRYMASQIGPYGFQSLIALPLSNGSVALLGAAGGIPSVDGSPSFAVWSPSSNSIAIYASTYGSGQLHGVPVTQVCGPMQNVFGFAVTMDRTAVIVGDGETLCELNATTGQDTYVSTQSGGGSGRIFLSPDGNDIAVGIPGGQLALYNAHTLAVINTFPIAPNPGGSFSLIFSPDSKTLFASNDNTVYAYSVATGQQIGWLSNIYVPPTSGGSASGPIDSPDFEAFDNSGLLAGPLEEGFGFLDTTTLQTGPVGWQFTNAYLTPGTGTTSGGTQVQWSLPNTPTTLNPAIYFGGNKAPTVDMGSGDGPATVTTPPGNPGPVPVYAFEPDGSMQLVPDGFSYGPSILEVTPGISTADGGGEGVLYGYGFGPLSTTTIPPNLSVVVGGATATIVGFNPDAYNITSQPFQLQTIYYTIPPGSSGSSQNVTVSSASGEASASNALSYLPAPQQYPLSGSQLAQGIYDPVRDLYYFTDTNRIQVFSLTQQQWLSPINIPAPVGTTQRLWGLALSPDGTKLVVADAQANVIYLINAANTSTTQTFSFAPSEPAGVIAHPVGVAISDAGVAYIAAYVEGGTGYDAFFSLNTNTGALTAIGQGGSGGAQDVYLRTVITSDNTRVFFNDDGGVFSVATATGSISNAALDGNGGCCRNYDLALSSNQTQFEATNYLYDTNLNAESSLVLNDREVLDISYVYGAKLSPDGTLLIQPSTNGIDVYDGRLGILLKRIALPFALSTNYDALVEDGQDNKLIAITGANGDGIAVVDLTSLQEPAPLPYAAAKRLTRPRGFESNVPHAKKNAAAPGPRVIPYVTHSILAEHPGTTPQPRL
jgi:hypothetical protein